VGIQRLHLILGGSRNRPTTWHNGGSALHMKLSCWLAVVCFSSFTCDSATGSNDELIGFTYVLISLNGESVHYREWYADSTIVVDRLADTLTFNDADSVTIETTRRVASHSGDAIRVERLRGSYQVLDGDQVLLTYPCNPASSIRPCHKGAPTDDQRCRTAIRLRESSLMSRGRAP
jgi:hypothetical protein